MGSIGRAIVGASIAIVIGTGVVSVFCLSSTWAGAQVILVDADAWDCSYCAKSHPECQIVDRRKVCVDVCDKKVTKICSKHSPNGGVRD